METREERMRSTVREGYQILLRAEAELILPTAYEKIASYYQALAEKCMTWATDVHGEGLRTAFANMESVREKSQVRTQQYRFKMSVVWEDESMAAILCESRLTGQSGPTEKSYHRLSHVWNLQEERILPLTQIIERFMGSRRITEIPFHPDGIYPTDGKLIFFRNPRNDTPFAQVEKRWKEEKA